MATPNIVPRSDSEGGIGTASKYWASAYIDNVFVSAGFVGRDADNRVDFAVDNNIAFRVNGSNRLHVGSNHLYPEVNNSLSLGYATREFSDLFLGDGAVINFNNGNFTLSHGSGGIGIGDGMQFRIGSGNDLRLYHSTDSYISNEGNGNLNIRNLVDDADVILSCDDGSGGVTEYFRLDGSDVITIFSKPIRLLDSKATQYGTDLDLQMYHSGGSGYIENYTGNFQIIQHENNADIVIQCDDGSGGVTPYIRVDGSAAITKFEKGARFNDTIRAEFGSSGDLVIQHDGSDSKIENATGDLKIRNFSNDRDIIFENDNGAGGQTTYFYLDGSSAQHDGSATTALYTNWPDKSRITVGSSHDLQIYHDGSTTMFQNQTGNLKFRNFADDSDIMFETDDGSGSYTEYIRLDGSEVETKFFVNTRHNDSVSAKFGTSGDLQIQHNGSNSYITANGTGDLYIKQMTADQSIYFQNDDGFGGEVNYLQLDGANVRTTFIKPGRFLDTVELQIGTSSDLKIYHNATDSILLNQTGDLYIANAADNKDIIFQSDDNSGALTTYFRLYGNHSGNPITQFPDNSQLHFGDGFDFRISHDGSQSILNNQTGNLEIVNNADNADIIFKCDDGSGGTETYFFLDGSATSGSPVTIFPDNSLLYFGDGLDFSIGHNGSNSVITNTGGNVFIDQQTDNGSVYFRCDDGSGGLTTYFQVDGASEILQAHKDLYALDNIKLRAGAAGDLSMHHDGTDSFISNDTGHLYIKNTADDKDIEFQCDDGSGGTTPYFRLDGSEGHTIVYKEMQFENNVIARFGTSNAGQIYHSGSVFQIDNITGNMSINNFADDGDIIFSSDDGSGGVTPYLTLDGGEGHTIVHKEINFQDAVRATFGAGNDLQVYHDSSNSYIQNETGILYIWQGLTDGDISFVCDDGSGGETEYFRLDGSTTSMQASKNIVFADSIRATFGGGADLAIYHDATNSYIQNETGQLYILNKSDDKDIELQSDDGSGNLTTYVQLDGSEVSTKILTQKVMIPNLPTSDPSNAGQLWNDSGTLKISAG